MDVLATLSVKEFNSLCRFCTRKQKNLKPIFKEENDGGCFDFTNSCVDNGIVNMLSECTGLETTPTDGLPLFICTECHQKLLDSHSFRNQCIESVDKLKKIRLNLNNVKNEDDNSNDQDNTFFADTFADDDGWGQDESENFDDAKTGDCQIVVEPISNTKSQTSKRKPPAKRKAPAKRKSKVSAKRKSGEDQETSEDVKVELSAAALAESAAEPSVDELKPELDPVTGEIVMPTVAVDSQENKPNRKRDRTKGPKVKKEKKPYVRKPNKPEQCDICGFISRSLKSHMLVHTQERNFECDFCGKKFALRASLKNHIFAHINIRSHKCTICLLQFKTEKTLKRHRAIHTTEYNFVCEICHKKFLHKDRLREHLKIHAMRRYSCPYCSQYFSNTGGLRSHIGIHTGIKPYSCGVCDMTFVNTSSASVHRRTHLVGNVFQCEKCFSEFKHFRSFTIHKEACFLTPEQLTSTNTT